jgi:catechol 2,3-dioxygenase-like lactoylglutathione lyase family enzyme
MDLPILWSFDSDWYTGRRDRGTGDASRRSRSRTSSGGSRARCPEARAVMSTEGLAYQRPPTVGGTVLKTSEVVCFLPSEDLERSERFFQDVLGLPLVSRSPYASVFSIGGATLRVTRVDGLRPQPFTVFGWLVQDLRGALEELRERGTVMLVYEGLDQDDHSVWTTPSGDLVAWFKDPDANVLSLTQLGTS